MFVISNMNDFQFGFIFQLYQIFDIESLKQNSFWISIKWIYMLWNIAILWCLFLITGIIKKHNMKYLSTISDKKYFNIVLCLEYFMNDSSLSDKYRPNNWLTEIMKIFSYINDECWLLWQSKNHLAHTESVVKLRVELALEVIHNLFSSFVSTSWETFEI